MISFVVPAHNEEACLGRTLEAIHAAAREIGQPYEILVADDASTDRTGEIARAQRAKVVRVNHRQIAATRNSGARAASGNWIFFVDADTVINARALRAALRQMNHGAVGGGAPFWVEGPVPVYVKIIEWVGGLACTLIGFAGGAFMFCTREAFIATGGFSEKMYWAEEGSMTLALRREGKFVVLWERVLTSGRRFRRLSGFDFMASAFKMIVFPVRMVTQRESVEKIWYDSNRAEDEKLPGSFLVRLSNGIVLLFLIILVTGPLWNFVPKSMTPIHTAIGKFRFFVAFLLGHIGLVLGPIAAILFVNMLRQKRWTGIIRSVVVIAFCAWQAWGCAKAVVRVWRQIWIWAEPYL